MSSSMIRCDNPGCNSGEKATPKVVSENDAHGWLNVRVYLTKPTREQVEAIPEQLKEQAEMQGARVYSLADTAPRPAYTGGDFCSMECLIAYANIQVNTVRNLAPNVFEVAKEVMDKRKGEPPMPPIPPVETAEDFVRRVEAELQLPNMDDGGHMDFDSETSIEFYPDYEDDEAPHDIQLETRPDDPTDTE